MRRSEREIQFDEIEILLHDTEYGVLSIVSPENKPYAVPMNFVYLSGSLYFHCASKGQKLDYLSLNDAAVFCVVGHVKLLPEKFGTLYSSAIASGTISQVEENEKMMALEAFIHKYSMPFEVSGLEYIRKLFETVLVLKMDIESLSGKARKS